MGNEDFNKLCDEFRYIENELMAVKRSDYTKDDNDVLINFKKVAEFEGTKPARIALTYLLKHIHNIAQAVETGKYEWEWTASDGEGLKQRIADARNYLLLLAACFDEEAHVQKQETLSRLFNE